MEINVEEFNRYLNFLNTGEHGDGFRFVSIQKTIRWFINNIKDGNHERIKKEHTYLLAILTYFESIYSAIEKNE